MENDKLLLALGLCARARGLVYGTPMVCEALRAKQKPKLVVEAGGNSQNTSKRIADKCSFYGVRQITLPTDCEQLALTVGKRGAAVAAVGITEEHLATAIEELYND